MIRVNVDIKNPGQFFGCCGLFELAQRRWPEAKARFDGRVFEISAGELDDLIKQIMQTSLEVLEPSNKYSSALRLAEPFNLRLDWWKYERGLKTWAGSMSVDRIAIGLKSNLDRSLQGGLFDFSAVAYGSDGKKVEPFYFDGRRGATALPLDLGFSSNELKLETVALIAAEFFTLIGLQRFRPREVRLRSYQYRAWVTPLPVTLAALAAAGELPDAGPVLQFESAFRTDQRKHKAFMPAIPVPGDNHE